MWVLGRPAGTPPKLCGTMNNTQDIVADLLARGLDDWVHLSEAMSVIRFDFKVADIEAAKATCLEAVQSMLDDGLIVIGDLVFSGEDIRYQPWTLPNAEAAKRVGGELDRSGGLPELSGEYWMSNTPKGDAVARTDSHRSS